MALHRQKSARRRRLDVNAPERLETEATYRPNTLLRISTWSRSAVWPSRKQLCRRPSSFLCSTPTSLHSQDINDLVVCCSMECQEEERRIWCGVSQGYVAFSHSMCPTFAPELV